MKRGGSSLRWLRPLIVAASFTIATGLAAQETPSSSVPQEALDSPQAEALARSQIAQRLRDLGPNADPDEELADAYAGLAEVLAARGDFTGAAEAYRDAANPSCNLPFNGHQSNCRFYLNLALDMEERNGVTYDTFRQRWGQAVNAQRYVDPIDGSMSGGYMVTAGRSLLALNRSDEAIQIGRATRQTAIVVPSAWRLAHEPPLVAAGDFAVPDAALAAGNFAEAERLYCALVVRYGDRVILSQSHIRALRGVVAARSGPTGNAAIDQRAALFSRIVRQSRRQDPELVAMFNELVAAVERFGSTPAGGRPRSANPMLRWRSAFQSFRSGGAFRPPVGEELPTCAAAS